MSRRSQANKLRIRRGKRQKLGNYSYSAAPPRPTGQLTLPAESPAPRVPTAPTEVADLASGSAQSLLAAAVDPFAGLLGIPTGLTDKFFELPPLLGVSQVQAATDKLDALFGSKVPELEPLKVPGRSSVRQ